MKPRGAKELCIACDLTYDSMEVAASILPHNHHYRLVVGRGASHGACHLLGVHIKDMEENPLCPSIGLEVDESYTIDEWSLWSGDACVWSPGA